MNAIGIASKLVDKFEGNFLKPYICPAGYRTVGRGHLYPKGGEITEEQSLKFLEQDLSIAMRGAIKYCPVLLKCDDKLAAVIDFCFNLGVGRLQISTLRRRINQEDWGEVKKELMRWVRGGGRILPGLVLRRKVECGLVK